VLHLYHNIEDGLPDSPAFAFFTVKIGQPLLTAGLPITTDKTAFSILNFQKLVFEETVRGPLRWRVHKKNHPFRSRMPGLALRARAGNSRRTYSAGHLRPGAADV